MGFQLGQLGRTRSRIAIGLLAAVVLAGIAAAYASKPKRTFTTVGVTGVQHMGRNFNIPEFYVDGYFGGNIGRGGGGGGTTCCVLLPDKWRPDLSVDVRWQVGDWSKENLTEMNAGNFKSITAEGLYRARVPVEKYDNPEELYVHFFAGGKVRVVSNIFGSESTVHQILRGDPHAADAATVGIRVNDLFSKAELDEMDRKWEANKKKYGDWR